MRSIILNVINSNSGIKEVQLAMRVMEYIEPSLFSQDEFLTVLNDLLEKKEIVSIHYLLPLTRPKVKSIYFPKDTLFSENK